MGLTNLVPYSEKHARRVANVLGPSCAAFKALAELERRRKAGENVALFIAPEQFIVGPPVKDSTP